MKRLLWMMPLLLLAACAGESPEPPAEVPESWEGYGNQVRVLYFAEGSTSLQWREEARALEILEDPAARIEATLNELLAGPREVNGRAFPLGCGLEQVFVESDGTLTLDFSESSAQRLSRAGSLEERVAMAALSRTLRVNFPELRRMRILVGGKQCESLGGHLYTGGLLSLEE
jgi:spore germination protein GerM